MKNRRDKQDPFLNPSRKFRLFCSALTAFARSILRITNRVHFGLRVSGRHNLSNIAGGAITVCNHVHMMDCSMVACQIKGRSLMFTTLPENLETPFLGTLVRCLGGFPVPETISEFRIFSKRIQFFLEQGTFVHFYPERDLIPYDKGLRAFHRGAFWYAYKCNVPIVPMVITYRNGFRCKPSLNLDILPPIYPDLDKPQSTEIEHLIKQCRTVMEKRI